MCMWVRDCIMLCPKPEDMKVKIESYAKHFTPDDSVIIFEVDSNKLIKYGNAIHRDKPIVYF